MDYSASGIAAYVADLEIENRQLKKELNDLRANSVNADRSEEHTSELQSH